MRICIFICIIHTSTCFDLLASELSRAEVALSSLDLLVISDVWIGFENRDDSLVLPLEKSPG
jgi:hypothetical protein